jgi:PKD repeat protein
VAAFDLQNNAPVVTFTNHSYGSPGLTVWDFGDGDTSQALNPSHTYLQDGSYQVCLTVTNNCGDSTICDSVTISTIAIGASRWHGFSVSPNPATDRVRVNLPEMLRDAAEVELCNLDGKILMRRAAENSFAWSTAALAPGVYFVRVSGGGTTVTRRLMVMH